MCIIVFFFAVSELYSLPPELAHKLHLLHLLRAKLVHFVNNLNNYLITRVRERGGDRKEEEREKEGAEIFSVSTADSSQHWS